MNRAKKRTSKPTKQIPWPSQSDDREKPSRGNPDGKDFVFRMSDDVDADSWIDAACNQLLSICESNSKRYIRGIDKEVTSAIRLCREIEKSPALQAAWCALPGWQRAKKKAPQPHRVGNLLEQVFRYFWALERQDQDGYELRHRAVKRYYQAALTPERIVTLIRENGGYSKSGRARKSALDSVTDQEQPLDVAGKSGVYTKGSSRTQDVDDIVEFDSLIRFEGCSNDHAEDAWWQIKFDSESVPITVHVTKIKPI